MESIYIVHVLWSSQQMEDIPNTDCLSVLLLKHACVRFNKVIKQFKYFES